VTVGAGVAGLSRAVRYGLATSALVLCVCAGLALVAGSVLASAAAQLDAAIGRTFGTVTAVEGDAVVVSWSAPRIGRRVDVVELAGTAPPVGTRTEVAYDPADPSRPLVPGAALLARADRALSALVLAGTVAGIVLAVGAWQLVSRGRAAGLPVRSVPVRRVRVQAGLLQRSWLETQTVPPRFVPVHFDPVLVGLPAPADVRLHGDPLRDRLVAAEVDGRLLHASGPVRRAEPAGRRIDNPSRPDGSAPERAARLAPLGRQLLADLPLLLPAPLIALLWTWVDGGGPPSWAALTLLMGALGLWVAALRGSDPS
jgi:hypothetical protein